MKYFKDLLYEFDELARLHKLYEKDQESLKQIMDTKDENKRILIADMKELKKMARQLSIMINSIQ